jgi:beta-glucanase (GH16 family)
MKLYAIIALTLCWRAYARPHPQPLSDSGPGTVPSGFTVVAFHDDFSGIEDGGLPSLGTWQFDTGTNYPNGPSHWGTSEVETYTSSQSNVEIRNGNLVITPQQSGGRWTSARIETTPAHDFACAPGQKLRMESRIKLGDAPAGSQMGFWPAFWALGAALRGDYGAWPSVGEIDVFESLNGAPKAWHTIHCGTAAKGGPCHESDGIGATAPLSRGDWHVLAAEIDRTNPAGDWRKETIAWFVDDRKTFSVSGAIVGDQAAWSSLAHSEHFLLLNVAVGGSFPDSVAKATTPNSRTVGGDGATMEVEYVGVYTT